MNINFDDYDWKCSYCGACGYFEVGWGESHSCSGTVQAQIDKQKRIKEAEIEEEKRKQKVREQARFLMLGGIFSYVEAVENIEQDGWLEDDDYYDIGQ